MVKVTYSVKTYLQNKRYCLCFKYLKTEFFFCCLGKSVIQYVAFICASNFHLRRELPKFYSSFVRSGMEIKVLKSYGVVLRV